MLEIIFENTAVKNARTELFEGCINYYNREGERLYKENKPMIQLGKKKVAQSFEEYLFFCLDNDAKAVFKKPPVGSEKLHVPYPKGISFEFGRGGNHFWVHENDKRVLMVTFKASN